METFARITKKLKIFCIWQLEISPQEIFTHLLFPEWPCQLPSTNLHHSNQDNFEWLSSAAPFNLLGWMVCPPPGPQNRKERETGVLKNAGTRI